MATAKATHSFSDAEMTAVTKSLEYWLERLPKQPPGIVLGLVKEIDTTGQSTAYSITPKSGRDNVDLYTYLKEGKLHEKVGDYPYHTLILLQKEYTANMTRGILDDHSLTSTITHEFMHALGMIGTQKQENGKWSFDNRSIVWTKGLKDVFGTASVLGKDMEITRLSSGSTANGKIFYLPAASADVFSLAPGQKTFFPIFHGAAVKELVGDRGLPLMGGIENAYIIDAYNVLGHPNLMGSIMSYVTLRNMLFTELELAALKDMGYAIDPKQSFGRSYYPTNLGGALSRDPVFANGEGGFLAENDLTVTNATAFNSGLSYGVGLHVYRDKLNVTQTGNINASGYGGVGIRVDGVGNTVTLPKGNTVNTDGGYGTGIAVSYGKNNVVNLHGNVQAQGAGGIGANFEIIAENSLNPHSYYYYNPAGLQNSDDKYFYTKMNSDLNGALVKDFTVSGTLQGAQAAIQVGRTAHVGNINLTASAQIKGNINVWWDPFTQKGSSGNALVGKMGDLATYGTNLNVGLTADGQVDPSSNISYTGIIDGRARDKDNGIIEEKRALALHVKGGNFSVNGDIWAYEVRVAPGAKFSGTRKISLVDFDGNIGLYENKGITDVGNSLGSLLVEGNFVNDGIVRMEFDADKKSDQLKVTGNFDKGKGKVVFTPVKDFYKGTVALPGMDDMFEFGSGAMPDELEFDAPDDTLIGAHMIYDKAGNELTVNRPDVFYAAHAKRSNDARVGAALDEIDWVAEGDMDEMLAVLDYSAADGQDVRGLLPQLSPAAYGYSAQASAEANLMIGRMAISQLRTLSAKAGKAGKGGQAAQFGKSGQAGGMTAGTASSGLAAGSAPDSAGWNVFVTPFASTSAQQQNGNMGGYNSSQAGLMGGFYTQRDALSLGLYTAFAYRHMSTLSGGSAEMRSPSLHLGGMAQWKPEATGWHVFAQAQIGVENIDAQRDVSVLDYQRQNKAFGTAFSGTAMLGTGWQWQWDSLALGPYVGLEYALNALPQMQEWQGQGTRLNIDPFTRHDLRGVVGVNMEWSRALGEVSEGRQLKASLDVAWRHDLLNTERMMRSAFVGYGQYGFDTAIERQGQGSLGLTGSVHMDVSKNVALGAHVQAEVLRPGYNALGGGLSLRWEF